MKKRFAVGLMLLFLAGCTAPSQRSSNLSAITSSSESSSSSISSSQESSAIPAPVTSSSSSNSSSSSRSSSSSSSSGGHSDDLPYYQDVSGTGRALFNSIRSRINRGYKSLGYDGLLSAYPETDCNADGTIHDYYSKTTHYKMSDANNNYKKEGDSFNREHSIPQSWWGKGTSNQGCDIYIVVPTDGYVNNRRSSFPFGETDGETYKSSNSYCKLGASKNPGWTSTNVFEPGDDKKGDFARIYFYALTKWSNACKWTANNGNSTFSGSLDINTGLTDYALNLFLKWHQQDPVDDYEIRKNNVAETWQGNRNPYVDHPEWVNSIWGGTYVEVEPTSISLSATKNEVLIGNTIGLSVSASPAGASCKVSYRSLNEDIASVDDNGVVTGLVPGFATIEATSVLNGSVKAAIQIEVKDRPTVDLEFISCKAVSVVAGKTIALEPSTYPLDAYPRPTYSYRSLNESIATVDASGIVTGVSGGETNVEITATQNEIVYKKEVKVTVIETNGSHFTKVTSSIPDGQYLLVAEKAGKALDASTVTGKKNSGNQIDVAINNGTIEGEYSAACFTIKRESTGYSIRNPNGKYVYAGSSGGFDLDTMPTYNTITIDNGEVSIKCDNLLLQYNSNLFRYYSSALPNAEKVTLYLAS